MASLSFSQAKYLQPPPKKKVCKMKWIIINKQYNDFQMSQIHILFLKEHRQHQMTEM